MKAQFTLSTIKRVYKKALVDLSKDQQLCKHDFSTMYRIGVKDLALRLFNSQKQTTVTERMEFEAELNGIEKKLFA